jgi:hypothetical protein
MAAIQLNFTLRTSSNCKTVHLLGSWDGYQGQLPLSKDPKKSGGWVGCFKFQGQTLKQGQRYWYYYIIDGYHVSHDPAKDHTTEPTTGRKLNIIDIPAAKSSSKSSSSSADRKSRRVSTASIPKGRGLSPERIVAPKPQRPHETRQVINTQYDKTTLEELNRRFALLIYHAKTNNTTLDEAYKLLREVEDLQSLYKQPTKKSQQSYDRLSNNTLKDMTTPFFMNGPEY